MDGRRTLRQRKDRLVVSLANQMHHIERAIRKTRRRLEGTAALSASLPVKVDGSFIWRLRLKTSNRLRMINDDLQEARSIALWGVVSKEGINNAIWDAYGWQTGIANVPNWTMASLKRWEIEAISSYFPRPPAHILIGGAGSGREAVPLARRGYRVTAFEPSRVQVGKLRELARGIPRLQVFEASYQDLPWLPAGEGGEQTVHLESIGPFDAAIFGWGSLSHILTHSERVDALRIVAGVTNGPILVSYESISDEDAAKLESRPRRYLLPKRFHLEPHTLYNPELGFLHRLSPTELDWLAADAGCELAWRSMHNQSQYAHAILVRYSQ